MTAAEAEALLPVLVEAVKQIISLVESVQQGKTPATDALTALSAFQDQLRQNNAAADAALDEKFK